MRHMTLRKTENKYLNNFYIWCWKRTGEINWTDKVSNDDVLRRLGKERSSPATTLRKTGLDKILMMTSSS